MVHVSADFKEAQSNVAGLKCNFHDDSRLHTAVECGCSDFSNSTVNCLVR